MKYHYVYRITNKITSKHYYGMRSSSEIPVKDLGIKYYSSFTNKYFKIDQINNPDHYRYKIIKVFGSRCEANEYEKLLHLKFDVKNNTNFINRQNQNCIEFDTTNKVSVIDKNGNTSQVSVDDRRYKSGELKGVTTGLVACIDIRTNKKIMVSKDEFKNNINLVSVTAAKLKVNIYDNNNNLIFETDRNFKKTCILNKLPYQGLIKSYKNNTKLFETQKSRNNAVRYNNEKYIGWYARLM